MDSDNGLNFLMVGFFFHKCDITYTILVFIHAKKTFRAVQFQMCGTYFEREKPGEYRQHLQKSTNLFWFIVKNIKISDIFYKIQKFLGIS